MVFRSVIVGLAVLGWGAVYAEEGGKVPIIYSSDLYHPHNDPDDHFDLMTLFGMAEFDIRAIIIDTGKEGKARPGVVAVRQMMHIAGRDVPLAVGLDENLATRGDTCEGQPEKVQGGVELILKVLREAERPVTIFVTGSLRDVAAAFNRDGELFRKKVSRMYVNAGHSSGKHEWNVNLDVHAYVRILRSDLPVYWVPCFGDNAYASYWKFKQGDVLDAAPRAVQNFFVYALTKADPKKQDPIAALEADPDPAVTKKLWALDRNMWCTGAFLDAAGLPHSSFDFADVRVGVGDDGMTVLTEDADGVVLKTFHVLAPETYGEEMTKALKDTACSF